MSAVSDEPGVDGLTEDPVTTSEGTQARVDSKDQLAVDDQTDGRSVDSRSSCMSPSSSHGGGVYSVRFFSV